MPTSTESTATASTGRSWDAITPTQQAAIDRLYEHSHTLLIAPKGFGKAMVGQTAAEELLADGVLRRVLVIAPLAVCRLTWAAEWREWEHLEIQPALAAGQDEAGRALAVAGDSPIVLLNSENVAWFFNTYGHDHGFDGLLVDESTIFKAPGGTAFKALRRHLADFTWRVTMSADPIAETGIDIYGQALVTDNGAALGRNKENFMRRYFYPTDYGQTKWAVLPGQDTVLAQKLAPMLHVVDDTAYEAELPTLVDRVIAVTLPAAAREAYQSMVGAECVEIDGVTIEAASAGVVMGKLQQITAGAIYDENKTAHWLHMAKLEALAAFLAKEWRGPVAVAYQFLFELEALRERFPNLSVLGDDPEGVMARWNAGEVPLMALHPKSAARGLNLQYGGCCLFVLTPPWGADPWNQLIGRLRRRGQPSPVVSRFTVVCEDTVDELILDRHARKAYDSQSLNDVLARAAGARITDT